MRRAFSAGERRGLSAPLVAVMVAVSLAACNALLGVEDATVSGGSGVGGEGGGSGAASGAGLGGAPAGTGGGSAAGASGSGAGGAPIDARLDLTFGDKGLAFVTPATIYAERYNVKGLAPQPGGRLIVSGYADLANRDYRIFGKLAAGFAARLDDGAFDATFGEGGYLRRPAQRWNEDRDYHSFVDPVGGSVLVDASGFSYDSDGNGFDYGGLLVANADGHNPLLVGGNNEDVSVYAALFSSKGCFLISPGPYHGGSSLGFSACPADWLPVYDRTLELASLSATELVVAGPLPPAPAGGDRFLVPILEKSTGRLGAVEIEHAGGSSVTARATIGGTGVLLVKTDSLDAAASRVFAGLASDVARKHVYLAGSAAVAGGNSTDVTTPFLVRASYTDGQLDPAFGVSGAVEAPPDGAWACLAIDAAGRALAGGRRGADQIVARFTPEGRPDPKFGEGGYLKLPFEVQACALDPEGRLLVAGSGLVGEVTKVVVARLLDNDSPDVAPASLPAGACAALDPDEPNETFASPARLSHVNFHCTKYDWEGMIVNQADVDWFAGPPSQGGCDVGPLSPSYIPTLTVSEAQGTVEACLFVDKTTLELGYVTCRNGDNLVEVNESLAGCCGPQQVSVDYVFADPGAERALDINNLYARVSPSVFGADCDRYHVKLTFALGSVP
jgi:hypothetical protein